MQVLVLNTGSSSIKFQLIDPASGERRAGGSPKRSPTTPPACRAWSAELGDVGVDAVGHRVVHGGERFTAPTLIDDARAGDVAARWSRWRPCTTRPTSSASRSPAGSGPTSPRSPCSTPPSTGRCPRTPTATPCRREWYRRHGVRRYGFHGTSHEYVAGRAATVLGRPLAELDLIVAHLGNGASMAAIAGGRCVDTSMGLSPLEGLVMGSRSGDVDPTVVNHVAAATGRAFEDVSADLNLASGLKGLCGVSDMREVTARADAGDEDARLAIAVFGYRIRKYVGAYLAVLGRCDALVFTGGIGQHSAVVRARACAGLEGLGIVIDAERNGRGASVVSSGAPRWRCWWSRPTRSGRSPSKPPPPWRPIDGR